MSLRIYTRTGDDGTTGLFGGERVSKTDVRIEACGAVDELNAQIGLVIAASPSSQLKPILTHVQNQLFDLGADLATPIEGPDSRGGITIVRLKASVHQELEGTIDRLEAELEPLRNFILPGGSTTAAALHVCRAVCRRAERRVVALAQTDATNPEIIRYLNRLSDLLFVMARSANRLAGVEDVVWKSGQT